MKIKKFIFTSATALALFSAGATLVEAQNSTSTVQAATTKKKVMHNAYYYKKDGKTVVKNSKGKKKMVKSYQSVKVSKKVTINGTKFYKISGKNEYIKAGSIDGTKRTLTHNAYIYTSKGKKKATLKKGKTVTTYGSAFTINGKSMYRVASGEYVVVGNFKKKTSTPKKKPTTSTTTNTSANTSTDTNTSTNTNTTSDDWLSKYESLGQGALVAVRDAKYYDGIYEDEKGESTSIAKGQYYILPDLDYVSDGDDTDIRVSKEDDGKDYIVVSDRWSTDYLPVSDFKFYSYTETPEYKNLKKKYIFDSSKYNAAKVILNKSVSDQDDKDKVYPAGKEIEIQQPELIFNEDGSYSLYGYVQDEANLYIPISSIVSYTPISDTSLNDED